jgi:hypothetical protein
MDIKIFMAIGPEHQGQFNDATFLLKELLSGQCYKQFTSVIYDRNIFSTYLSKPCVV